jgi:hypothetical protein
MADPGQKAFPFAIQRCLELQLAFFHEVLASPHLPKRAVLVSYLPIGQVVHCAPLCMSAATHPLSDRLWAGTHLALFCSQPEFSLFAVFAVKRSAKGSAEEASKSGNKIYTGVWEERERGS